MKIASEVLERIVETEIEVKILKLNISGKVNKKCIKVSGKNLIQRKNYSTCKLLRFFFSKTKISHGFKKNVYGIFYIYRKFAEIEKL
jgi:hypothetical protein